MTVISEGTDAANTTSTAASMGVGDYFFGTLEAREDSDWIEVSLEAGQTYTFGLTGVGALSDSLSDPFLRLRSSDGTQVLLEDDDGGPGRSSAITYTANTTETFYLDVQSWNNTQAGDYGLSMVEGDRASFDVMMGAGNLIRDDASWAPTPGTAATVTWSIRASGEDGNGFIAPSAAQVAAIEDAMDYLAGVSGLTLNQINAGGTSNNATMVFGAYAANDGAGAYAYFPGSTATSSDSGDVWLNNNSVSTGSLQIGSYSYFTVLHEIGHALGLAHPGDYNAGPGVSITYTNNAQFSEDSHQYSVMSYFDEGNTSQSVGGYPDTLMLFDLLALHQQYGADLSFHAGSTVYGFNATVGGAYDFTVNTNPLLSIWDGGGTDTIDLSGYADGQVLNLTAGEFSSVGGYQENLSIAIGAVIENAIGGSGRDVIRGNAVENAIDGGGNSDFLRGYDGDDTLAGGSGNDHIYGDRGDDALQGGLGNDFLNGGSGADVITGGIGRDIMYGNGGADEFVYNAAAESTNAGTNWDRIIDFTQGQDLIDLSHFNARFIDTGAYAANGNVAEIRIFEDPNGDTRVFVDVNADGTSNMRFYLVNTTGITADDFIL